MDYDQDFIGLEGYNFPENGNRIFQEDFKNEQEAVGQEVIDRESDLFTRGVITGGEVTASATSGCIDIAAVLARDAGGRRIHKTSQNAFAVPDGQTVKIIVRHVWSYSGYVPDGSGGQVSTTRTHSAEFGYIPDAQEPEEGEVLLRRVSRSGSTVTIRDDLRSYSTLKSLTLLANYYDGVGKKNLVYNSDFTLFNNKTGTTNWYDYKHPDGWIFSDNGSDGKIGYDASAECCKIITSSDGTSMSFKQGLHEFPRWQNKLRTKKVTVKIRIKGSASISVTLFDGVNTVQKSLAGSGVIETIDLPITVNVSATGLWLEVMTTSSTQAIEIYGCYANLGDMAIPDLPCQIGRIGVWFGMDEDYPDNIMEGDTTEIPDGYSRLESWLNKRFGIGAGGRSKLPKMQGRFMRVLANGSVDSPDSASRTDRGDGTTGDKVGTLEKSANWAHKHAAEAGNQSADHTHWTDISHDHGPHQHHMPNGANYNGVGYVHRSDGSSLRPTTELTSATGVALGVTNKQSGGVTAPHNHAVTVNQMTDDGSHGAPEGSREARGININILAGIAWS